MGFRLLILVPEGGEFAREWPDALKERIPDITVDLCHTEEEAMEVIDEADAAYGKIVPALRQG